MSGHRSWIGPVLLFTALLGAGGGLAVWKRASFQRASADAANQPEPMDFVTVAVASVREYRRTVTSIGTVLALQSISLRNEIAGTVRATKLIPGQVVDAGAELVSLDVSVEEAELRAQEAQAVRAEAMLKRTERAIQSRAVSAMELDSARAERDFTAAQMARTRAIIERKTLRAPFRARIGMADLHVGQYLNEGTFLTTLQGVDEAVHVDFTVAQRVAVGLREGDVLEIFTDSDDRATAARIVAVDARIDPATRNATVRARIEGAANHPPPGASVRVRVPVGAPIAAVAVPVSALRKGPNGDYVFAIKLDPEGKPRAHVRQVKIGTVVGDEVLLLGGLNVSEQVAASGSFKLRESVLVAIAQESGAGGSVAR